MALTEVQQHILSYFTLTNVSSLQLGLEALQQIMAKSVDGRTSVNEEQLSEEIRHINCVIQKYDLEIVETIDELTSEKLFILINTGDSTVTQKSKFYEQDATQFFSKIVKDCVLSDEGHVSEIHCLNLSSQVGLSKTAAQSVLEKFVKDKWLISRDGTISLGMRSIVELEQNIKQLYPNEVKYCPFCKLIIIQGYICFNCKLRCHFACLKKYSNHSKSSQLICPKCKENWMNLPAHLNISEEDAQVIVSPIPAKKRKKSLN